MFSNNYFYSVIVMMSIILILGVVRTVGSWRQGDNEPMRGLKQSPPPGGEDELDNELQVTLDRSESSEESNSDDHKFGF